jgi:hypothetical protein
VKRTAVRSRNLDSQFVEAASGLSWRLLGPFEGATPFVDARMLLALVNPPRGLTGVERLVPAPRSAPFGQLFGRLP